MVVVGNLLENFFYSNVEFFQIFNGTLYLEPVEDEVAVRNSFRQIFEFFLKNLAELSRKNVDLQAENLRLAKKNRGKTQVKTDLNVFQSFEICEKIFQSIEENEDKKRILECQNEKMKIFTENEPTTSSKCQLVADQSGEYGEEFWDAETDEEKFDENANKMVGKNDRNAMESGEEVSYIHKKILLFRSVLDCL